MEAGLGKSSEEVEAIFAEKRAALMTDLHEDE